MSSSWGWAHAMAAALLAAVAAKAGEPSVPDELAARHRACREQPWREADPDCRDAFRKVDHSAWRRGSTLTFVIENDAIVGPDRDYTNGAGLIFSAPPELAHPESNWLDRAHDALALRFTRFVYGRGSELSDEIKQSSFRLAQQLYTPEDLTLAPPDPKDRPYAAWTYLSFGRANDAVVIPARADTLSRRGLTSTQIEVGVVGPSAGGEWVQSSVHDMIGAQDPKGWDYQVEDELGLALRHERKLVTRCEDCRDTPFDLEWERHVGFALGNIDTSLSAGFGARLGVNMGKDYGPARLHPSLDGSSYFVRGPDGRLGGYVFAGGVLRLVGRNVFLDGGMFHEDGPGVQKKPLVGDFQYGGVALMGPVKLSLSHIYRTEEFNGQARDTEFDALGVSVRF